MVEKLTTAVKGRLGVLIFFSLLFSGCVLRIQRNELYGNFVNVKDSNQRISFTENGFALIAKDKGKLALYMCCDTIVSGIWGMEKRLVWLSTPQLKESLNIKVTENKNNSDSVYFRLNSPFDDFYDEHTINLWDPYSSALLYSIYIETERGNEYIYSPAQRHDTNVIVLFKPPRTVITRFWLCVYPKSDFPGRFYPRTPLYTNIYNVKGKSSNDFSITMTNLSFPTLIYPRLNRDFVRVLSKNELEWDGAIYRKTD